MKSNIFVKKIRIMWYVLAVTISILILLIEILYRSCFDIISIYTAITTFIIFILFGIRLNMLLKLEGMYDALTSIGNRKKFNYDLRKIFKYRKSFSICYIDIDNFKGVNDKNGHNAGDEYLIVFADYLQKIESNEIMVYRIGGDEFVCILLDVYKENIFIEYINKINGTEIIFANGKKENISFSVGIARNDESLSLNEVLEMADKIMYNNKRKL